MSYEAEAYFLAPDWAQTEHGKPTRVLRTSYDVSESFGFLASEYDGPGSMALLYMPALYAGHPEGFPNNEMRFGVNMPQWRATLL